jgi:hypothetical protein
MGHVHRIFSRSNGEFVAELDGTCEARCDQTTTWSIQNKFFDFAQRPLFVADRLSESQWSEKSPRCVVVLLISVFVLRERRANSLCQPLGQIECSQRLVCRSAQEKCRPKSPSRNGVYELPSRLLADFELISAEQVSFGKLANWGTQRELLHLGTHLFEATLACDLSQAFLAPSSDGD